MLTFDDYVSMGDRLSPTPGPSKDQRAGVENAFSTWAMDGGRQIQVQKASPSALMKLAGGQHERWKTGAVVGLKKFGDPTRFFANEDHKAHFKERHPWEGGLLERLESLAISPRQNQASIAETAQRLNIVGGLDKYGIKINEHIQAYKRVASGEG